ncbi:unnamed protein product (macronuclear) [Paramecium tetraurelia]|uniref:Uncharacterized protein n=1 Tax=Paramecium tetraurelia TaxID=5888 RepID=A0BDG7_PARTE|nr:uncharacterized protein GSPATT00027612001 [Paramecium tetraurelia]CAK56584.1 unnamed protein product [Paramecium tetraurelia]|eukprot:XP_001423982.1 hypothetical protein (macronuclear) [Paramecium tetraurelia strain d4-2]
MEKKIVVESLEPSINQEGQLVKKCEGDTDKIQQGSIDKQQQLNNYQEDDCGYNQQLKFHNDDVQVEEVQSYDAEEIGTYLSLLFQEQPGLSDEQVYNNEQYQGTDNVNFDSDQNQQLFSNEGFIVDQTPSEQEHRIDNRQRTLVSTRVPTKFPGETKNLPKCLARRIKDFITSVVKDSEDPEIKMILNNPEIKRFLEMKSERISKQKLDLFIQSDIGSIFCKEFFGNCLWSYGVTKEGKTNVETCFRYNIQYFTKTIKKRRLN